MVVYKLNKSKKWILERSDRVCKKYDFGQIAIDCLNDMIGTSDYEKFKKIYANQVSPYRLGSGGYNTNEGRAAVAQIQKNLENEKELRHIFNGCQSEYEAIKSWIPTFLVTVPALQNIRDNSKDTLFTLYDNLCEVGYRFCFGMSEEDYPRSVDDSDIFRHTVFTAAQWSGVYVLDGIYTDNGEKEIADKYIINHHFDSPQNEMFVSQYLLFALDLKELFFGDIGYIVKICPSCGSLFATVNNKSVYCVDCSSFNKKGGEDKKNRCRICHNQIVNLINNSKSEKHISRYDGIATDRKTLAYQFRIESNYYWDSCQGKTPKTEKLGFYEDITSESAYYEWLKTIQTEVKA